MKELSIVIVSYNTAQILKGCLCSVVANCASLDAEIFVVDNASVDGSSEVVAHEFPEVHLIRNESNLGFATANNQAIRAANGRYILLLNSDTVILGDVLESSVRYMSDHPDIGVLGCRVLNLDRTLQLTCSQEPSLLNLLLQLSGVCKLRWPKWFGRYQMTHWDRRTERDVDVVSGCYMMVRESAIRKVGMLDESFFFFAEETDWCRRFANAGWRVVFAPVGEIIHYGSASALSLGHNRDLLLTNGLVRYHRKHGGLIPAVVVWPMLFAFALNRYIFWIFVDTFRRTEKSTRRRMHFREVLRDYRKAWPTGRT